VASESAQQYPRTLRAFQEARDKVTSFQPDLPVAGRRRNDDRLIRVSSACRAAPP